MDIKADILKEFNTYVDEEIAFYETIEDPGLDRKEKDKLKEKFSSALNRMEEETEKEAVKTFGEYIISAGLVDETDFRYEMKEYLEEVTSSKLKK